MKREDVISLLVYVLMIVTAVMVGLYVVGPLMNDFVGGSLGSGGKFVWALLFVVGGVLLNVILIELGHMLGAKMGGYKYFSVNMLGLCFYKKGNKWKVKFSNFDGLTGETKIAPVKEEASPRWYSLMPLIFYTVEVVVLMVLFNILKGLIVAPSQPSSAHDQIMILLRIMCILFVTIGGMLTLYNIFPTKLDTTNDGYRLTLLSKKENVKAFNELMRIECAYAENQELLDMKTFDEINDFTCSINLFTVYKHLKNKNYGGASVLLDKMIAEKGKISRATYCSAVAQKMFIVLLTQDYQTAKAYYDAHVDQNDRRFISNDLSMPSIRAYMLISSMLDISEHEARYAKSRVKKALKRTLPGRVAVEEELYQLALNKVDQVRPEWHIKDAEVK
ncbi:MAG: hypothetical protein MJ214_03990 [Bacilli bacterium]|nr:hypothetical protein [Bacilli bacterium]